MVEIIPIEGLRPSCSQPSFDKEVVCYFVTRIHVGVGDVWGERLVASNGFVEVFASGEFKQAHLCAVYRLVVLQQVGCGKRAVGIEPLRPQ